MPRASTREASGHHDQSRCVQGARSKQSPVLGGRRRAVHIYAAQTRTGTISYSCETLTEIVRRLHQQAGIENGNASAARRTFAAWLHRDGRSLKLIQELIGVSSVTAVKKLIEGDPVRLASIVSGVI